MTHGNFGITWICSNNGFIITRSDHTLFEVVKGHFDICDKKNYGAKNINKWQNLQRHFL